MRGQLRSHKKLVGSTHVDLCPSVSPKTSHVAEQGELGRQCVHVRGELLAGRCRTEPRIRGSPGAQCTHSEPQNWISKTCSRCVRFIVCCTHEMRRRQHSLRRLSAVRAPQGGVVAEVCSDPVRTCPVWSRSCPGRQVGTTQGWRTSSAGKQRPVAHPRMWQPGAMQAAQHVDESLTGGANNTCVKSFK